MSPHQPIEKILKSIRLINDAAELEAFYNSLLTIQKPTVLSFVNAHAVNIAYDNALFLNDLASSDILLRDGMGMRLMLSFVGQNPGLNMNGTDLIPSLFRRLANKSFVLYGTEEPWLTKAISKISDQVQVLDSLDGFQADAEYVQRANSHKPDVILLAMGMPKQERVAALLKESIQHPCLIINGGAILDFISDRFPRAPIWIRELGFEWLFRFILEPKRLFNRYMLGNLIFMKRAAEYKRQRS